MKTIHKILFALICSVNFSHAQESPVEKSFSNFSNGEIISSESAEIKNGSFRASQISYDNTIIGVFEKLDGKIVSPTFAKNPILKNGICSIKYNSENGAIKKGDLLTSSSTPGEAMKATKSGMIVGIALEDAVGNSGLVKARIMVQYVKQ